MQCEICGNIVEESQGSWLKIEKDHKEHFYCRACVPFERLEEIKKRRARYLKYRRLADWIMLAIGIIFLIIVIFILFYTGVIA